MKLVGRHAGRLVVVLLLVTFVTSLLLSLVPGNAAQVMAGENATPEQVHTLERQLGLDRPLVVRYAHWVWDAVHGDLGRSYRTGVPLSEIVMQRFPVTLELAVLAMIITLILSTVLASVSALTEGSFFDRFLQVVTSALLATPPFVLALVLVFVVAVKLNWLPVQGWSALSDGLLDNLKAVALPVLTVSLPETAVFQRVLRADLSETLKQDYVLLARSKGLSNLRVLFRHCLRPASVPLVTLSGLSFARLLGGTIIVEYVFSLPGLGSLMVSSVAGRDIVLVQGLVLIIATAYLVLNFLIDLLYGVLDPRMKVASA